MAAKEVFAAADRRLVAELEWRVLDAAQSLKTALRTAAAERVAAFASTVVSPVRETVRVGKKSKEIQRISGGFFVTTGDGEKPAKGSHSLAAAFAAWAADHLDAVLSIQLPSGQHVVVVLQRGLPVLDKVVQDAEAAYKLAKPFLEGENVSVFADDNARYPRTLLTGELPDDAEMSVFVLESLAAACSVSTQIRAVPIDLLKVSAAAFIVVVLLGGYLFWKERAEEERRRQEILLAEEQNPTPKYLGALSQQRVRAGVSRQALVDAFEASKRIPSSVNGWALSAVRCSIDEGCSADFLRGTGTFESLVSGVPFLKLEGPPGVTFDQARMSWEQPLDPASVGSEAEETSLHDFLNGRSGSQLQNWMVAGLGIQVQPPSLWPKVPGISENFNNARALAQGKIEVGSVLLPLLKEVLTSLPPNVILTGWEIKFSDPRQQAINRASATVRGNYYVRN
jgi:hypothetical protein